MGRRKSAGDYNGKTLSYLKDAPIDFVHTKVKANIWRPLRLRSKFHIDSGYKPRIHQIKFKGYTLSLHTPLVVFSIGFSVVLQSRKKCSSNKVHPYLNNTFPLKKKGKLILQWGCFLLLFNLFNVSLIHRFEIFKWWHSRCGKRAKIQPSIIRSVSGKPALFHWSVVSLKRFSQTAQVSQLCLWANFHNLEFAMTSADTHNSWIKDFESQNHCLQILERFRLSTISASSTIVKIYTWFHPRFAKLCWIHTIWFHKPRCYFRVGECFGPYSDQTVARRGRGEG